MQGGPVDSQTMINVAVTIAAGALGWFVRVLWDADKSLRSDLHQLEKDLPTIYARRDDMRDLTGAVFERFDRIEAKIDRLAERK